MSLSKKSVKSLLAFVLVLAIALCFVPSLSSTMNAEAKDFGGKRVGCWWWSASDINEPNATNYLQCMKDSGVNEIYLSCFGLLNTDGNRAKLHGFVEKAKSYGCRVSVLYGEWDDFANNSAKNFDLLVGYIKTYNAAYPNEPLYGIHMDIEPGNYNATVLQNYADKFIARVQAARAGGTYIEVDVNCGWNGQGGTSTTLNGVTGIYNILAKNFDAVFAMSYRNTMSGSDTIATFSKDVVAACKSAGTPVFLGVETDNVTPAKVTFYGKSKEYMFGVMDQAMAYLAGQGLKDYGMAIHMNRSLYQMKETTPTTAPPAEGNCIWSGAVNMDITTKNTVGIIKVDSLTEAIRNDIAAYGPATKYVVTSDDSAYKNGPSGYCVFGFYQDANSAKGLEYLEAWGTSEKGAELQYCTWEKAAELTKMGADVNFCVFSDGTDDVCHIGNLKVYAFHGGTVITTAKPASQATTQPTTPVVTPTEPIVTQTNPVVTTAQPTMPVITVPEPMSTASMVEPTATATEAQPTETATATEAAPSETATATEAQPTGIVVDILYGDANDDGEINMKDVLAVRKYVADIDVYINFKTSDVNGDELVNMKDILAIRMYIADLVSELGPNM